MRSKTQNQSRRTGIAAGIAFMSYYEWVTYLSWQPSISIVPLREYVPQVRVANKGTMDSIHMEVVLVLVGAAATAHGRFRSAILLGFESQNMQRVMPES